MENLPLDRFINGISLGQMGRMIFWAGRVWRTWDLRGFGDVGIFWMEDSY